MFICFSHCHKFVFTLLLTSRVPRGSASFGERQSFVHGTCVQRCLELMEGMGKTGKTADGSNFRIFSLVIFTYLYLSLVALACSLFNPCEVKVGKSPLLKKKYESSA